MKRPPETFRADEGMKGVAGSDDDGEGGDALDPIRTWWWTASTSSAAGDSLLFHLVSSVEV